MGSLKIYMVMKTKNNTLYYVDNIREDIIGVKENQYFRRNRIIDSQLDTAKPSKK